MHRGARPSSNQLMKGSNSMFSPDRVTSMKQNGSRVRLTALALLLSCSIVLSAAVNAIAQDEKLPRTSTSLNTTGFLNPSREFLSAGALLALAQASAAQ